MGQFPHFTRERLKAAIDSKVVLYVSSDLRAFSDLGASSDLREFSGLKASSDLRA